MFRGVRPDTEVFTGVAVSLAVKSCHLLKLLCCLYRLFYAIMVHVSSEAKQVRKSSGEVQSYSPRSENRQILTCFALVTLFEEKCLGSLMLSFNNTVPAWLSEPGCKRHPSHRAE